MNSFSKHKQHQTPLLISVHMPKTAGLSFRAVLEEHFGGKFRHDYADYPLASPVEERHRAAQEKSLAFKCDDFEQVRCIHGHFLPAKYLLLADLIPCRFVTWLREPVARLVSQYYYWQRAYDAGSEMTSSIHRRVIEEGWSLRQFCLAPEFRNIYSQFLWGFPVENFSYIGVTEYYDEDLEGFSEFFLGEKFTPRIVNSREGSDLEGKTSTSDPDEGSILGGKLRQLVESYHALDVALYRKVLSSRGKSKTLLSLI